MSRTVMLLRMRVWGLSVVALAASPGCRCRSSVVPTFDAGRVVARDGAVPRDTEVRTATLPSDDAGLPLLPPLVQPRGLMADGGAVTPDEDRILEAVRGNAAGVYRVLGGPKWVGGDRFVAILSARDSAAETAVELLAVVVRAAGQRVVVEGRVTLPVEEVSLNRFGQDDGPEECVPSLYDRSVGDLDGDGSAEVAAVIQYCTPTVTSLGYIVRRELFVLDSAPTLRLMAQAVVWDEPQDERRDRLRLEVDWRDVDRDGRNDIALTGARCVSIESEPADNDGGVLDVPVVFPSLATERRPCTRVSTALRWDRALDAWRAPRR